VGWRKLLIVIIALLVGYLLLAVATMVCQRKLLYQPSRYSSGAFDKVAAGHGLTPWRKGSERIGWCRMSSNGAARARVLITHGNAGSALDRLEFVEGLQSVAPFDVYVLEYPGYGDRTGSPAQAPILAAAAEALELLTNKGPVFVVGESLGTGVAAYLAGRYPAAVKGLMLFCPYNNLTAVAQHHMRILPVRWLIWDRFPAGDWLKSYHGPVGMLVMKGDIVVPARFGHQLYASYSGPKKLWEVEDGGHNDACVRPSTWWREVLTFWGETGGDK
jgi:pimeloyl-ACP methyl ester carboxylesterase